MSTVFSPQVAWNTREYSLSGSLVIRRRLEIERLAPESLSKCPMSCTRHENGRRNKAQRSQGFVEEVIIISSAGNPRAGGGARR
jgi:hypothetical protein